MNKQYFARGRGLGEAAGASCDVFPVRLERASSFNLHRGSEAKAQAIPMFCHAVPGWRALLHRCHSDLTVQVSQVAGGEEGTPHRLRHAFAWQLRPRLAPECALLLLTLLASQPLVGQKPAVDRRPRSPHHHRRSPTLATGRFFLSSRLLHGQLGLSNSNTSRSVERRWHSRCARTNVRNRTHSACVHGRGRQCGVGPCMHFLCLQRHRRHHRSTTLHLHLSKHLATHTGLRELAKTLSASMAKASHMRFIADPCVSPQLSTFNVEADIGLR